MPTLDDYAAEVPHLKSMVRVHTAWIAFGIAAFVMMFILPFLGFALFVMVLLMIPVTLTLMMLAAGKEIGVGYAVKHFVLYILLLPFGFIGPIVVPFMVWSDLTKRRAAEERITSNMTAD